jgi:hypothetical protein
MSIMIGVGVSPSLNTGGGGPFPVANALVDADFLNWRVYDGSTGTPDDKLTFTYTNDGFRTLIASGGVLSDYTGGTLRRSYRYGASALQIERAATGLIRNNQFTGAVAGSPGTLPNNWGQTNGNGLTRTISLGTESGIPYIGLAYVGTPSDANGLQISQESTTQVDALNGETFTHSQYLSITNITGVSGVYENFVERTAAGAQVVNNNGSDHKADLTSALQRFATTRLLAGGGTVAKLQPRLQMPLQQIAVNFQVKIGLVQLEKAASATSAIKTVSAARTRNVETLTKAIAGETTGTLVLSAWRNATPSGVYACVYSAAGKILVRNNAAGTGIEVVGWDTTTVDTNLSWALGTKFSLVVGWSGNDITVLHTGGSLVTDDQGTTFDPTLLAIGHDWDGAVSSGHANADIERVAVTNG